MALERYRALSEEIQKQAPGFETGLQLVDELVASLQKKGLLPKARDFRSEEASPKTEAEELIRPEPSPEIVEVQKILTANGFEVAQIAYVDREKKEVTYAVIETFKRPDYTDGTQMCYHPAKDPLAELLERGRAEGKITVPDFVRHVPAASRFAVSWDEVHSFVVPEVVNTIPSLAETVSKGSIVLRVPTKAEFQFAGRTYPHFGEANSWEWLYDDARFGGRLVGGDRDSGGLGAVDGWLSGSHDGDIVFRLQAVSLPQKFS